MALFAIIETDAGLAVTQVETASQIEEAAIRQGGMIVDPGPYLTFEDAYDSMLELQREEAELEQGFDGS